MNGQFELITPKQFAQHLHRKRDTIPYLEEQYPDFPKAVKIGRRVFYRVVDVERWLAARFAEAGIVLEVG